MGYMSLDFGRPGEDRQNNDAVRKKQENAILKPTDSRRGQKDGNTEDTVMP